jgi:hypothetical protein
MDNIGIQVARSSVLRCPPPTPSRLLILVARHVVEIRVEICLNEKGHRHSHFELSLSQIKEMAMAKSRMDVSPLGKLVNRRYFSID